MNKTNIVQDIIDCVNFATIKHKNQRRKDKEATPYINHPIGVAHILTHEANITDVEIIQAALLHDVVEDTDTSYEEIEEKFGTKVRNIVEELTDDKTLPKAERKALQIQNAGSTSTEAKLVRLADKLYNLRDCEFPKTVPKGWNETRVHDYFIFSKGVTDKLKGTNSILEEKLEEIYQKKKI